MTTRNPSLIGYLPNLTAAILIVTGLLKLAGIWNDIPLWDTVDPVFLISRRWVYAGAGIFELFTAVLILVTRDRVAVCIILFAPVLAFLLYRFGMHLVGSRDPCPCLGSIASWSEWLGEHASAISNILLYVLIICAVLAPLKFLTANRPQMRTPKN